jgi:hypothetical protein
MIKFYQCKQKEKDKCGGSHVKLKVGTAGQNGRVDRSSVAQGGRIPIPEAKVNEGFYYIENCEPKKRMSGAGNEGGGRTANLNHPTCL